MSRRKSLVILCTTLLCQALCMVPPEESKIFPGGLLPAGWRAKGLKNVYLADGQPVGLAVKVAKIDGAEEGVESHLCIRDKRNLFLAISEHPELTPFFDDNKRPIFFSDAERGEPFVFKTPTVREAPILKEFERRQRRYKRQTFGVGKIEELPDVVNVVDQATIQAIAQTPSRNTWWQRGLADFNEWIDESTPSLEKRRTAARLRQRKGIKKEEDDNCLYDCCMSSLRFLRECCRYVDCAPSSGSAPPIAAPRLVRPPEPLRREYRLADLDDAECFVIFEGHTPPMDDDYLLNQRETNLLEELRVEASEAIDGKIRRPGLYWIDELSDEEYAFVFKPKRFRVNYRQILTPLEVALLETFHDLEEEKKGEGLRHRRNQDT